MGQGLFIKVAQVVAESSRSISTASALRHLDRRGAQHLADRRFDGLGPQRLAAWDAANTIRSRMVAYAAEHFGVAEADIAFADGTVRIAKPGSNQVLTFGELARLCWLGRVSLSATGYYKTPKIHWDPVAMHGRPFFYFSFGAAMAEVAIDTLTGESRVLRADLVQDCGRSLNPAIDLGQIEGAFVQGQGWLTCEELWWDASGRLRTAGPSTYKIPGSRDVPPVFNVKLLDNAPSREATIFRSKAVGEPPLMLATAVWTALKDAVGAVGNRRTPVRLDAPATPERVLAAVEQVRRETQQPLHELHQGAVHFAPGGFLVPGFGDPEGRFVEGAGQQKGDGLDIEGLVGPCGEDSGNALAQRAQAVRRVDLAPAMPAQHGGRIDQIDAAHGGIETGIDEGARALDQCLQGITRGSALLSIAAAISLATSSTMASNTARLSLK